MNTSERMDTYALTATTIFCYGVALAMCAAGAYALVSLFLTAFGSLAGWPYLIPR